MGPGFSNCRRGGRQYLPEGNKLSAGDSGRIHPAQQRTLSMRTTRQSDNANPRMSAMRYRKSQEIRRFRAERPMWIVADESEVPALSVRHQKVPEYLNAGDRLKLFRIDKIGIKGERVGFSEQLNQTAIFLDEIVRQYGNAEPALAGTQDAEHIVYSEVRCAGTFAVPADLQQPAPVL